MSKEVIENKILCLNCQTELQGEYCHVCGQKATQRKPTVKEFILEYLNIAFVWDTHFLKTLWQLLRRPGHLTNEYVSGKFVSYTHPLKLNMFLLFVFITLFVLFRSAEDMGNSIQDVTRNDVVYPMLQIDRMSTDAEYADLMLASKRDTVELYAPLLLPVTYPDFIGSVDEINSFNEDSIAVWTASVPHNLIEDGAVILHEDGYYRFNTEFRRDLVGVQIMESIWEQMTKMITNYFPILILLTAPLLSFVVRMVQRKSRHTQFGHFIFSLHYIALLEIIIIVLYLLHLTVSPPGWVNQWFLVLGSFIYLTIAIRRVYETKRWIGAVFQTVLINIAYWFILMTIFIMICMISVVAVAIQMA